KHAAFYRRAPCPNCGCKEVGLDEVMECPGDQVLVNKGVFDLRSPRRWEMAVFRRTGTVYVKRIIGLPGEKVQISREGDLLIDGKLERKTLSQFKALRVLVYDNDYRPADAESAERWESVPSAKPPTHQTQLVLDGTREPRGALAVNYRHYSPEAGKSGPVLDEYGYNGGDPAGTNPVHDFMVEFDVEIVAGQGTFWVGLTDGSDHVIAELPVAGTASNSNLTAARLRESGDFTLALEDKPHGKVYQEAGN